jgi:hypothetical protein
MKKRYFIIAIVLVMTTLSAYGCSSTTTIIEQQATTTATQLVAQTTTQNSATVTTPATLSSITVAPQSPANLPVGVAQTFVASGTYSNGISGVDISSQVTWTSSNPNIATISSSGLATCVAVGSTNISAHSDGMTSNIVNLTVVAAPAVSQPVASNFVWNFDMDNLQDVTMSLPKANISESVVKHSDNQEFYFDVTNGPEVDSQRWGGAIPALLSGPEASSLVQKNATTPELQQYGLGPSVSPSTLNMDIKLTILSNGTPVNYEIYIGGSNPSGTIYYVRLAGNTDVYSVDKSWYDVLVDIVTDPPYIATSLLIDTPTVSASTVTVGGTETVNVNVTNNGDVSGSFTLNLLIGGNIVDSKVITMAPRASQVVSFAVAENTPGQYVASINTQHNVTFTVQ